MQSKTLGAGFKQNSTGSLVVTGGTAQMQLAADAARIVKLRLTGNAVINHIDNTPYRAATVQQCAGAAQHFDAFHADGVSWYGVVMAEARGIHTGSAVLQNADAVALLAPNDGAAGIGPEIATADAWRAIQSFAQRALGAQEQGVSTQRLCGGYQVNAAQRIAGHGHLGQLAVGDRGGFRSGVILCKGWCACPGAKRCQCQGQ